MEGYSLVRVKRLFIPHYVKVWCELDGQKLFIYEKLDTSMNVKRASNLKSSYYLRSAVVSKLQLGQILGVKHGIVIRLVDISSSSTAATDTIPKKKCKKVVLDYVNHETCTVWYNAFVRACLEHTVEQELSALPDKCCKVLQLDPSASRSIKSITSQYKKLSLLYHPDRNPNGDSEAFRQLNQAYNSLVALTNEENDKNKCTILAYEATIEKGQTGIGLGITIQEVKIRRQILVGTVLDNIVIHSIDPFAGSIHPGDTIVGIDNDDTRTWLLSRMKARLGPNRVAIGTTIKMRFERRVYSDKVYEYEALARMASEGINIKESPSSSVATPIRGIATASLLSDVFLLTDNDEQSQQQNRHEACDDDDDNGYTTYDYSYKYDVSYTSANADEVSETDSPFKVNQVDSSSTPTNNKFAKLLSELQDLRTVNDKLTRDNAILKNSMDEYQLQLQAMTDERSKARHELRVMTGKYNRCLIDIDKLKDQLQSIRSTEELIDENTHANNTSVNTNALLNNKVVELQHKLSSMSSEKSSLESNLAQTIYASRVLDKINVSAGSASIIELESAIYINESRLRYESIEKKAKTIEQSLDKLLYL